MHVSIMLLVFQESAGPLHGCKKITQKKKKKGTICTHVIDDPE